MTGGIAFIGGGNMASCLIGGMIADGFCKDQILVSEPRTSARSHLQDCYAIETTADSLYAASAASLIVLAVKPQILATVAREIAPSLAHKPTIVSIAAGIPVVALEKWLGHGLSLIRAMPNTPAMVQNGATGLFANGVLESQQKDRVEKIFNAVGYTCWVDREELIDAVTAVSGSGPAYFFLIFELMQKIGRELGLTEQVAKELTLHTALGASRMALQSESSASELREQVTSPGGTTQAALQCLYQQDVEESFRQAMISAVQRAKQMSLDFSS
jgi:pyrroline-5-carboxylate reductase